MKFNKAVDEETITNSTIKLVKGSETMAISLPTIENGVIAFKSLSVLDADAEYKVVVDGIKSKDGKDTLTNTTIATFKSAKTVVAKKVTVANLKSKNGTTSSTIYDATTNDGVSLNVQGDWDYTQDTQNTNNGSAINVKFDTPVDKSTINSKSIQLIDVTTGKNIAVEGNQVNYTDALIIKVVGSKDYLTPKHQYKLLLDGLKAANGMDIDTFSVTFAYQAGKPASVGVAETSIYNGDLKDIKDQNPNAKPVDKLVNPLTTSKMLDDGQTFKAAASVIVDFGAAEVKLDESTVTTDYLFIREKDTQKRVAQTISYNKELNRVTLTPSERLKDDTDYEIFESPYIKNIYGVTLGAKDSDYATAKFTTLDVTAPTVAGQPESTLEDKSVSKLPTDKVVNIKLKMSEKIDSVSLAGAAKSFAAGTGNGNILITRADDDEILSEDVKTGFVTPKLITEGKDQYIQFQIDPTGLDKNVLDEKVKGKTFRVTLAGTNPTRKNDSAKVITDQYSTMRNAMANDYSFTFTFEGDDKTAPKITDVKIENGKDYTPIQGMTNVDLSKKIRVYFDCTDVDVKSLSKIELYKDSTHKYYPVKAEGEEFKIVKTSNSTSYVDLTFGKVAEGSVTLKAQDVADDAGNLSSLQTYDFIAGNGPAIDSVTFATPSKDSASADSYVLVTFKSIKDAEEKPVAARKVDTTTLDGNIKLMNGDKEVKTTIDTSDYYTTDEIKVMPSEKLSGNTKYTLIISKDIKDTNGNCLQQNPELEPADYKVELTTKDDAKPEIKETPEYKDGKLTIKFNTKLDKIDSLKVINSKTGSDVTNSIVDGSGSVNGDGNVEITFKSIVKDTQYNVSFTANAKNGSSSPISTSFSATEDYKKIDGADLTATINGTAYESGAQINNNAKFVLGFNQYVSVSAIKELTITNVGGKDYKPDVKYIVGLDGDGNLSSDVSKIAYAKDFTVDVPGLYEDKNYEFRFTLAAGTKICLGSIQATDNDGNKINDENGKPVMVANIAKSNKAIDFVLQSVADAQDEVNQNNPDDIIKGSADKDAVAVDKVSLNLDLPEVVIASSITLPGEGANGTTITWSSDKTSIINPNNGSADISVTRDQADDTDDEVTLTATIKKNDAQDTKEFTIKVKEGKAPSVETKLNAKTDNITSAKLVFSEALDEDSKNAVVNMVKKAITENDSAKVAFADDGKTLNVTVDGSGTFNLGELTVAENFKVKDLAGNEATLTKDALQATE
ncbi:MAG: Ig-like domain-containing protein [Lachnospiraceae bacterium]|nr:Ig-like domain-containing protein [Lachnospiraceae bacterium]